MVAAWTNGAGDFLIFLVDEDVAEVFTTPESVNKALRALIEVVPQIKRLKRP